MLIKQYLIQNYVQFPDDNLEHKVRTEVTGQNISIINNSVSWSICCWLKIMLVGTDACLKQLNAFIWTYDTQYLCLLPTH